MTAPLVVSGSAPKHQEGAEHSDTRKKRDERTGVLAFRSFVSSMENNVFSNLHGSVRVRLPLLRRAVNPRGLLWVLWGVEHPRP